jgi:adenylate kinase family enzyme
MFIIEFFGPSGSGKSYLRKRLISKYLKEYAAYDYKSINLNLKSQSFFVRIYFKCIKSNFIQLIKNTLKIKNLKISFLGIFFNNYKKKIEDQKLNKNNYKKFRLVENLIKKSSFSSKKKIDFLRWSKEEIIGNELARNNKNYKSVLIDSEGLIQRLFIYCYRKSNKKELIKKYLNTIKLPDILIYIKDIKIEKKINKNIDKNEIKTIYSLTLKFLKQKKILLLNSKQGIYYLQKNILKKIKKHKYS